MGSLRVLSVARKTLGVSGIPFVGLYKGKGWGGGKVKRINEYYTHTRKWRKERGDGGQNKRKT